MNRSILIVICDFLLVSLLAFSTVDMDKLGEAPTTARPKVDLVTTNEVSSNNEVSRDLASVMRLALDEERRDRQQMEDELARVRKETESRDTQIQQFEESLRSAQATNRALDQQVQDFQQRLRST